VPALVPPHGVVQYCVEAREAQDAAWHSVDDEARYCTPAYKWVSKDKL
jgi:hypothetical protein